MGIALGVILFLPIFVCLVWFPRVLDARYDWAHLMYVGVIVLWGILIARYWNFLGNPRLWLCLSGLALLNLAAALLFSERLRGLSHWDIIFIVAVEVWPMVPFLDWLLNKGRDGRSHRSPMNP